MNLERYIYVVNIAIEAVFANKFRSILTALGIIFGVAAVIAMLAIGTGARQEILDQMKLVGVNNIVITPKSDIDKQKEEQQGKTQNKYSPGLTIRDAESIKKIIPSVLKISPEVIYDTYILKDGIRTSAKLTGVTPDFFEVYNLKLSSGNMFNQQQLTEGKAVCIIGPTIKAKFFSQENPVGKYLKCGNIWLQVIGTLENLRVSEGSSENLGISDYNNNIYAPIQTVLLRYRDRSLITPSSNQGGSVVVAGDDVVAFSSSDESTTTSTNQLDKIVVQVKESEQLNTTTHILEQMLKRRHSGVPDFEIKIPELLLNLNYS
ncbi:MAG: ABC transporter permease [Bacteroidetes bacterium]|nr:ABC transporter permease [Bacteroidota bacterium]